MPFTAKYVVEHYYSAGCLTDKLYVGVATNECVYFSGISTLVTLLMGLWKCV